MSESMAASRGRWLLGPLLLACALLLSLQASAGVVHHRLDVRIDPAAQTLEVVDEIQLARAGGQVNVTLHTGLQPRVSGAGVSLEQASSDTDDHLAHYRVMLADGVDRFTLRYGGRIAHDFTSRTESPGRQRQLLAGSISGDGVFLSGAVAWYPLIDDSMASFELTVSLPEGWLVISQGRGPHNISQGSDSRFVWASDDPQDDIYLVAGRYTLYRLAREGIEAQVFLLTADDELAQRYLDVTHHYLGLYAELIGDYPYSKFALVENFWQTGYGMPSFTLLGSRVIRLPFILHSSYPHEILHNWWGNSVYVDYQRGNWAEGLTAYLADHLIKEQRGQGVSHRRTSLQRFASFVREDNDFPLADFRSRHSGSSQAVGYDRAMMLFHMLRRKLGDEDFIAGLRRFYRDQRFQRASWVELRRAFEQASGRQLDDFFGQWVQRPGQPRLEIVSAAYRRDGDSFVVDLTLRQDQLAPVFGLDVPLLIHPVDDTASSLIHVAMDEREQHFAIPLEFEPARLQVDPWLDLFRELHPSESPPVLSDLFGSSDMHFILPADGPAVLLRAYRQLAEQWSAGYQDSVISLDSELDGLPADRPVWLLGWRNRFADRLPGNDDGGEFSQQSDPVRLAGRMFGRADHSFVQVRRDAAGGVAGWLASEDVDAIAGLARKLPHYGRYSYLVFQGKAPDIRHRGQWPIARSALSRDLAGGGKRLESPEPAPLWPAGR